MPVQRYICQLTGNHCRQPYRNVQQEYRHIRGLTTNQVNLRHSVLEDDEVVEDAIVEDGKMKVRK